MSSEARLEEILRFTRLLNELRTVERVARVQRTNRWENDVEHSYNLAMLAWYIVASEGLDLDQDKVLRYALAHDFIEIYSGDTYIYSDDPALLESKERRERDAKERLERELADFPELLAALSAYMERSDREAKFVYALDKIEPMLEIYNDGGRTWKEKGIKLSMLIEKKADKVKASPEMETLFGAVIALLKSKEPELFG